MAQVQKFANNASAVLGSTSEGAFPKSHTTLTLGAGQGSMFPTLAGDGSDFFLVTMFEKTPGGVEERIEILKIIARTDNTLTVGTTGPGANSAGRDIEGIAAAAGEPAGGYAYPSTAGAVVYVELRLTAAGASNMVQPGTIPAATSKATPVDADVIPLSDSAASNALKKLTWANLKATLVGTAHTWSLAQTFAADVILSGVGNRIKGDFSENTTLTNRAMFQSSVTDGASRMSAIPNGTSQTASWSAYNNSTVTDASFCRIAADGTLSHLISGREGSGSYLPLSINVGGNERWRITTDGALDSVNSPAYVGYRAVRAFNADTGATSGAYLVAQTAYGGVYVQQGSAAAASGMAYIYATGATGLTVYCQHASATLRLGAGGTERFRIGAAGQFGIGGADYGTSGQVLTSGGSGAPPTWTNASSSPISNIMAQQLLGGF